MFQKRNKVFENSRPIHLDIKYLDFTNFELILAWRASSPYIKDSTNFDAFLLKYDILDIETNWINAIFKGCLFMICRIWIADNKFWEIQVPRGFLRV